MLSLAGEILSRSSICPIAYIANTRTRAYVYLQYKAIELLFLFIIFLFFVFVLNKTTEPEEAFFL